MLEKLYGFLSHYFTLFIITFLIGIFVVLPMMSDAMIEANGSDKTPDSEFFYSPDDLEVIAGEYSIDGKEIYMFTRFNLDLIWPIIYTTFFMSLIGLLTHQSALKHKQLIYLLPIIGFLFDILENVLCSLYFNVTDSTIIANAAALASATKWIILFGLLVIIIKLSFEKAINYIK